MSNKLQVGQPGLANPIQFLFKCEGILIVIEGCYMSNPIGNNHDERRTRRLHFVGITRITNINFLKLLDNKIRNVKENDI